MVDRGGGRDDSGQAGPEPSPGGVGSIDELLLALSHRRRRLVLYALPEDDATSLESLARDVAACEFDCATDAVASDEFQPVLADLSHTQLPRLDRIGLVEYDRAAGTVGREQWPEPLDVVLEWCRDREPVLRE